MKNIFVLVGVGLLVIGLVAPMPVATISESPKFVAVLTILVKDAGVPLSGAHVEVMRGGILYGEMTTGNEGAAVFSLTPNSLYDVTISHDGYQSVSFSYTSNAAWTYTEMTITLEVIPDVPPSPAPSPTPTPPPDPELPIVIPTPTPTPDPTPPADDDSVVDATQPPSYMGDALSAIFVAVGICLLAYGLFQYPSISLVAGALAGIVMFALRVWPLA